ncbi:MAG: hypothetical protein FWD04_10540 [Conexibacteraceae bacterium]|nr:hypothetical protein [Conexibacteraceae bacterium]
MFATPPLDLADAARRLGELRSRARLLLALTLTLTTLGGCLVAVNDVRLGVPLLIGASGAFALLGLCRGDRRRLLVALVAQGDAWNVDGVSELAARLRTPRERGRLADGLRAAADVGTGLRISLMVDPSRADAVRERLVALAERFNDPLVSISGPAAAICRRLLCDPQHSPLYNTHLPEEDLGRVLDLLERELTRPQA